MDSQTGKVLIRHMGTPGKSLKHDRVIKILHQDLKRIHEITQARGVTLILLTYADSKRKKRLNIISNEIQNFGRECGITGVDPREHFQNLLFGRDLYTEYFLSNTDTHPNARGYHEISILVANVIGSDY